MYQEYAGRANARQGDWNPGGGWELPVGST